MRKYILCLAVFSLLAVSLTGCKTTEALTEAVTQYCEASPEGRAYVRTKIDLLTAPHHVRVECFAQQAPATGSYSEPVLNSAPGQIK